MLSILPGRRTLLRAGIRLGMLMFGDDDHIDALQIKANSAFMPLRSTPLTS